MTEPLSDAATTTIARRPRSARRTSHIDIVPTRTERMADGLALAGRARDLVTAEGGEASVVAEGALDAEVGPQRTLESLSTTPDLPGSNALVGTGVLRGFRAAAEQVAGDRVTAGTPLHTLLDDLPVASLISGYADLYTRETAPAGTDGDTGGSGSSGLQADICAGWQRGGTMMVALDRDGRIPLSVGPTAPTLERADDPAGWHRLDPLGAGTMRRRRLVDVALEGGRVVIAALFRDSHVGDDGIERVLHEYALDVEAEPDSLLVLEARATPHVLPWVECPQAADSARRLVGHQVGHLRSFVRRDLRGTTTCTHLNDLLRSVDDVVPLWALVTERWPGGQLER